MTTIDLWNGYLEVSTLRRCSVAYTQISALSVIWVSLDQEAFRYYI